jgi:hypothetical protein
MRRITGWEKKLDEAIATAENRRFKWGTFDCALFVCDCVLAMTGVDLAQDFRGTYQTGKEALKVIKAFAGSSLEALAVKIAEANGISEIPVSFASRGDVVLIKQEKAPDALGIVGTDARFACCASEGLAFIPISNWKRAWRI